MTGGVKSGGGVRSGGVRSGGVRSQGESGPRGGQVRGGQVQGGQVPGGQVRGGVRSQGGPGGGGQVWGGGSQGVSSQGGSYLCGVQAATELLCCQLALYSLMPHGIMGNVAKHHGSKKKNYGMVTLPLWTDRFVEGQTRVKTLPSPILRMRAVESSSFCHERTKIILFKTETEVCINQDSGQLCVLLGAFCIIMIKRDLHSLIPLDYADQQARSSYRLMDSPRCDPSYEFDLFGIGIPFAEFVQLISYYTCQL